MSHLSLYRKYRPSTFDDVVGQQHIERTLRNAVSDGKVAHAYLFTGPRGTGKTTTARLLAKALLCERGPTDEPDGDCEQCVDIAEGRHPDVFELDAASRNGVEAVRDEIIGRVQFAPTRGRYKVYIIDEVHMLSTAAFNALLKTLEEPPPHVVFVMCTTHPHKVPETIHSRCQRFDFRRISNEEIADRLRFIAESEGFRIDRGAFALIARHAEGGMRDAITALEQLAAFTGGEVTIDDVEGLLGEVDAAALFDVAGLIARRDIAGCFRWVRELSETGADFAEFTRQLMGHVRDLYVVAAVGDADGVVDRTAEEKVRLMSQATEFGGKDRIARVLDLLGELASELRWSSDPRLALEVALTRMARPQGEMTLDALAERVEALEYALATGAAMTVTAPVAPAASSPVTTDAPQGSAAAAPAERAAAAREERECEDGGYGHRHVRAGGRLDRATAKRNWQAVFVEIKKLKSTRAGVFTGVEVDVDEDGETLVIEFAAENEFAWKQAQEPEFRELVRMAMAKVYTAPPPFRYQLGRGAVRPVDPDEHPSFDEEPVSAPVVETDAPEPGPTVSDETVEIDAAPVEASQSSAPGAAAGGAVPVIESLLPDVEPLELTVEAAAATARVERSAAESKEIAGVLDLLGARIVAEIPEDPDGEDY